LRLVNAKENRETVISGHKGAGSKKVKKKKSLSGARARTRKRHIAAKIKKPRHQAEAL